MRTTSNNIQRCMICGTRLSVYNDDILCFLCQDKKEKKAQDIEVHKPMMKKMASRLIKA
jgi:hypothetical protein